MNLSVFYLIIFFFSSHYQSVGVFNISFLFSLSQIKDDNIIFFLVFFFFFIIKLWQSRILKCLIVSQQYFSVSYYVNTSTKCQMTFPGYHRCQVFYIKHIGDLHMFGQFHLIGVIIYFLKDVTMPDLLLFGLVICMVKIID